MHVRMYVYIYVFFLGMVYCLLHYFFTLVILQACYLISIVAALSIPINPLNPELKPICYLLALLAHHFLHVSRIRVKSLTLRLLMSYIYIYIYMEHLFLMFLDHLLKSWVRIPPGAWIFVCCECRVLSGRGLCD